MKQRVNRVARIGERIGDDLSVLGVIDGGSIEPVYIVWNHAAWCPMACKVFGSFAKAESESKILLQLTHPNIVRCFSVGRPAHMLMPFLEGQSLAGLIDGAPRRRLGISDTLRLAIHIGGALQHVHDAGFLHMDVKPANIMMTRSGLPVLFDFGSARRISEERPKDIVGTDAYIAPEECRQQSTTRSADVFSLGVTIYEALTGELPFGRPSARRPFPQLTSHAKSLRKLRPTVKKSLEQLVMACLSSMPGDRPSLAAFLIDLHRHIDSGPPMWPPGFEPRPKEHTRAQSENLRPCRTSGSECPIASAVTSGKFARSQPIKSPPSK